MAQLLTPLASSAVDYETSPTFDPPSTSFPYPERQAAAQSTSRGTSDTTLHSVHAQDGAGVADIQNGHGQYGKTERQQLASRKFETEFARPVAPRMPDPGRRGFSNPDQPVLEDPASEETSSDSDTNSSGDENPPSLQRAKTQPAGHALSKSQLNRVRTHQPKPDHLKVGNEFFRSQGRVARDGRLNISVNETAQTGYLAKALGATIQHQLGPHHEQDALAAEKSKADFRRDKDKLIVPRLNIVIMVVSCISLLRCRSNVVSGVSFPFIVSERIVSSRNSQSYAIRGDLS
jgi:hypothetical protein